MVNYYFVLFLQKNVLRYYLYFTTTPTDGTDSRKSTTAKKNDTLCLSPLPQHVIRESSSTLSVRSADRLEVHRGYTVVANTRNHIVRGRS